MANSHRFDSTALKIELQMVLVDPAGTAIDLSPAGTTAKMRYRKSDGTTGEWSATISDAVNGIISYNMVDSDFTDIQKGKQQVAGVAIWADGKESIGEDLLEFNITGLFDEIG